jgi:hypothetical protein
MFLDGVTYSSISKNLANGIGSFWKPHFTKTMDPIFYGHPPLVFGIESLFFRILGCGIYTERIYTFLTAVLTAIGIVLTWRIFNIQINFRNYSWLPVLLWIITPLVMWSYKNNLLENTMGVFTLFSIYFISRALMQKKIIWLIIGNTLIFMAFLCKGFVGLFPMASVIIFWIAFSRSRERIIFIYCLLTILIPAFLFITLIVLFPEFKENISSYIHHQLLPSLIQQKESTTKNHFAILFQLLLELTFPFLLLTIFMFRQKITRSKIIIYNKSISLFFILIGISASLPLIVSLKQRSFYLVPSVPYFILALSFLIVPFIKNIIEALSKFALTWIKILLMFIIIFTVAFSIFIFGTYSRNEIQLKDIYIISENIPTGTIIRSTKENSIDLGLTAYMCRIGYLSLDYKNDHEYFLIRRNEQVEPDLIEKYKMMDLDLKQYIILKKKSTETYK